MQSFMASVVDVIPLLVIATHDTFPAHKLMSSALLYILVVRP